MKVKSQNSAQNCSGSNCGNSRTINQRLSYFRFPKDRERCIKWIENSRRPDLSSKDPSMVHRNHVLCADHFEPSQFMNSKRNKLIWSSIPTIFDVPDPPLTIDQEKERGYFGFKLDTTKQVAKEECYGILGVHFSRPVHHPPTTAESVAGPTKVQPNTTEEAEPLSDMAISPAHPVRQRLASAILTHQQQKELHMRRTINRQRLQLWRLKKQLRQLKAKNRRPRDNLEELIKNVAHHLPAPALHFFANQIRSTAAAHQRSNGKRWTDEQRQFALELHRTSADAYQLCSRVFGLPSTRTLHRWRMSNDRLQQTPTGDEDSQTVTAAVTSDSSLDEDATTTPDPNLSDLVPVLDDCEPELLMGGGVTDGSSPLLEQQLDVFAPLSPMDAFSVGNQPEQIQIQFDSDQLDPHTLQLIADLGSLSSTGLSGVGGCVGDCSTTITAMREVSPEGTVTITPITSGCPITVADNTVKLEIVTLGLSTGAVNVNRMDVV